MSLTGALVDFAVGVIDRLGYAGVFVLMTLESMVAPVPSEGVMPFAGFLVARGRMDLWLVTAVATLGSIAGSWISYEMGKHLGRPFIVRWGRWVLLSERDLDATDRFFRRWGSGAVFLGRFVPVVRHLVSIPAGVARMRLAPFLAATAAGAFLWNLFLAWVGMRLGEHWETVGARLEPFDYAIVAVGVVALVWFVLAHVRQLRNARAPPAEPERRA
jgi:membrane protein DedA with SNARE-associated domain